MSEFRFAEPEWAPALLGVVGLVALLFWLERRGGSALDRLVSPGLQARLVSRPSPWRRRVRVLFVGLSAGFLVLALMRPQWGLYQVVTPRVGAEIMICLDVSKSMLAEDVVPNRLDRAKAEIADLLAFLEGDQVGLIAFAGRATVLSPLTPDFGFLRLVLDNVDVHSVTRGGTRIGDAIRKALAGFGPAGEASRAILLITDGEDHDSFPRDAAKLAAEAGVQIVAIGFGDETGAEVYVSEPRTGARTKLLDGNGRPVRSRLDGELLRDLALATEGAYVPAGTGVLDLESIYERHIAQLTRGRLDPRGRTVRDEGYQWAVLLALIFLVSSVAVSAGSTPRRSSGSSSAGPLSRASALLLTLLLFPSSPLAQEPETAQPVATAESNETQELELPRDLYNHGVRLLARAEPDEGERWFRRARRKARGDGELRAAAAYNMGWTFAERARETRSTDREQALRLLYEAADWFRDAVEQQPEDAEARHNLEVVLRQALLLADELTRQEPGGLESKLRELAERQRELVVRTAGLLEELGDGVGADSLRDEFRSLATMQRVGLSDADRLAGEAGEERDALESRPEEERSPEEGMRAAQLANVLHYLHRARERMGQTRRQLRQRQGERGYRRASAALEELKRSLDQLRDPVSLLEILIRDAMGIAGSTGLLATSRNEIGGVEEIPRVPAWLTLESLTEEQRSISERTGELDLRLQAGIEGSSGRSRDPGEERLLEAAREAEPFVREGQSHLERAAQALDQDNLNDAQEGQVAGITALLEARERFLDLRGLIEAAYAEENGIRAIVGDEKERTDEVLTEYRAALVAAQAQNLERAGRLEAKLEEEKADIAMTSAEAVDEEAQALQEQRFQVAGALLTLARGSMKDALDRLGGTDGGSAPDWPGVRAASEEAVRHLEGLRRLFFSIVEHLREVAERQVDLADETRDVAALAESTGTPGHDLGPLVPMQTELAERSVQIANALEQQSRQEGPAAEGEANAEETSQRLRQAGEHVLAAETEMREALSGMESEPTQLEQTGESQQQALGELYEALALLVPPEQRQSQSQAGQDESEGESGDPERAENKEESMDPAQLLQAVRDREAQRRRERAGRESAGYETVEKDW